MSKLAELIKVLCPDGVEYRPLKDLFDLKNGYTPSKAKEEYWKNGTIPWFRMEDLRLNGNILSNAIQKVNSKGIKGKLFPKNSIIMATTATIGEHALILTDYMCNQQFTSFTVKEEIKKMFDIKFIFYYFFLLDNQAKQSVNTSSFPSVQMNELKKLLIPLPPLPVQEEIVRILDNFTELTTELTKELTMRKQQYEYYREKLLTFGDEVEWKSLEEVGELVRGNGLTKTDFTEKGVPAIHYGQIYTLYGTFITKTKSFVSSDTAKKLKKVDFGDVVITNTSENLKDVGKAVAYLGIEQAVTGGHATIFKPSKSILGKYFVYFTQTEIFSSQKRKYAKGTKVIDLSASDMSKILIPIPPLEEQQRIVDILDRFDTLVNDIKEGLPAEIEARQKQYEYYRDKLLSFSKIE